MKRDETKLESAMARSELNRNTLAEFKNPPPQQGTGEATKYELV